MDELGEEAVLVFREREEGRGRERERKREGGERRRGRKRSERSQRRRRRSKQKKKRPLNFDCKRSTPAASMHPRPLLAAFTYRTSLTIAAKTLGPRRGKEKNQSSEIKSAISQRLFFSRAAFTPSRCLLRLPCFTAHEGRFFSSHDRWRYRQKESRGRARKRAIAKKVRTKDGKRRSIFFSLFDLSLTTAKKKRPPIQALASEQQGQIGVYSLAFLSSAQRCVSSASSLQPWMIKEQREREKERERENAPFLFDVATISSSLAVRSPRPASTKLHSIAPLSLDSRALSFTYQIPQQPSDAPRHPSETMAQVPPGASEY